MQELWSTILAPLLDALRPALTIDAGGEDGHLAKLTADFVEAWDGRVHSWRWQADGEPPPGEAEMVLVHGEVGVGRAGELLEAVALAAAAAGRPLPVLLVHGVETDGLRLAAVRRFTEARLESQLLVLPGLGGLAIAVGSPAVDDAHGRLGALVEELRLSRAASRHLAAVERRRLAERTRAERIRAQLARASERTGECELLTVERDELRSRVRELADELAGVRASD
jgi:hypothetical protein